tara:strand:+ start:794 stop:1078 length:285 start_codon:yes stop_codon:yes gene_type:complete
MMIRAAILLFAIVFTGAVLADAPLKWQPLPPQMRIKFDQVMSTLWHDDCRCWRFLFEQKVYEYTPAEMDDDLRWSILKLIEIGEMIPIKSGPPS